MTREHLMLAPICLWALTCEQTHERLCLAEFAVFAAISF